MLGFVLGFARAFMPASHLCSLQNTNCLPMLKTLFPFESLFLENYGLIPLLCTPTHEKEDVIHRHVSKFIRDVYPDKSGLWHSNR